MKGAPLSFALFVGIGVAVGWWVTSGLETSELSGLRAQVASVAANRDLWKDRAEAKAIPTQPPPGTKPTTPGEASPADPKTIRPTAATPRTPIAAPSTGHDSFVSTGPNNGIVGPVTMNLGSGTPSRSEQRGAVLSQLTQLYILGHGGITPRMAAGMELPPADFLNGELEKQHAAWRVRRTDGPNAETYEVGSIPPKP